MRRGWILALVVAAGWALWAQAPEDYVRAEEAALAASSWKDLRTWFATYATFDEGQIAVMNDGFVELALSRRWEELPKLAKEADRDPAFLRFVLTHLNEGTECAARRTILANAEREARPRYADLCRAIAARLRDTAPPECPP